MFKLNWEVGRKIMTEQEVIERLHEITLQILKTFDSVCKKYDIRYYMGYGSLLGAVRHQGFIPWDEDIDLWMDRKNYKKLLVHRDEFGEAYEFMSPEDYGENIRAVGVARLYYRYGYIKIGKSWSDIGKKINRFHVDIFLFDPTYSTLPGQMQKYELFLLNGMMNAYRLKGDEADEPPKRSLILRAAQSFLDIFGRLFPLAWLRRRASKVAERYDDRTDTDIIRVTTDALEGMERIYPKSAFEKTIYLNFEDMKVPVPSGYDTILKIIYNDYMTLPPVEERVVHFGPVLWSQAGSHEDLKQKTISVTDMVVFDEPREAET